MEQIHSKHSNTHVFDRKILSEWKINTHFEHYISNIFKPDIDPNEKCIRHSIGPKFAIERKYMIAVTVYRGQDGRISGKCPFGKSEYSHPEWTKGSSLNTPNRPNAKAYYTYVNSIRL